MVPVVHGASLQDKVATMPHTVAADQLKHCLWAEPWTGANIKINLTAVLLFQVKIHNANADYVKIPQISRINWSTSNT